MDKTNSIDVEFERLTLEPKNLGNMRLNRFLRDWSGTCIHLHAQGNEGRHEEFLNNFKKFEVPHIIVNSKIYKASEKIFIQHLANNLGLLRVSSMTIFETRMNELLAAEDLRCVFVFTNAEEMGLFNPIMLQHFLNFVTMNPQSMKLLTVSILPWCFIEARLMNYCTSFARVLCRLPGFTEEELAKIALTIPEISSNPISSMSVQSLRAYLPKNMNPIFLKKIVGLLCMHSIVFYVAARRLQNDECFQRLPANVALALICSYMATWNPSTTDQRFVGERSQGKRRGQRKNAQDLHESSPKQFKIARLKNLYTGMQANLLAECGPFKPDVQIPILVQFGHLERVSDTRNLKQPKFRCSAPLDYVEKIFDEFVKKHTVQTSHKTTTDDFRSYLYTHQF